MWTEDDIRQYRGWLALAFLYCRFQPHYGYQLDLIRLTSFKHTLKTCNLPFAQKHTH